MSLKGHLPATFDSRSTSFLAALVPAFATRPATSRAVARRLGIGSGPLSLNRVTLFPYGFSAMVIHFRLDPRLGTPTYLQIAQQVRRALIQGILSAGDRLPTAREVVNALTINPNTVLKAYAELERDGLVVSRPGLGTFIAETAPKPIAGTVQRRLRPGLDAWLSKARAAGLNDEAISALFVLALDESRRTGVA